MKKLPKKAKLTTTQKIKRIIKHRLFGVSFTVIGLIVPILFFAVGKNYRPLIYPPLHVDQTSPKQLVEEESKALPSNLPKPEVIEHGSRFKHQVALTFDADMTPAMLILLQKGAVKSWYNAQIKQTLDSERVKATVFLSGLWVKTYPVESKQLVKDPLIELGNHSFSHPAFTPNCYRLPMIDNSKDQGEIESTQSIISQTTGVVPKYFRFPGGCFDTIDLQTVAKLGLKIVHWDVAAGDGFNQNADDIVQRVLSHVKNGSIIAMHIHGASFAPKTNEALQKIIPELKKQGYQFVTISELLAN